MEKARWSLIQLQIQEPKRKMMKLLKYLENGVDISDLKSMAEAFLTSEEKEFDQHLQDVLWILKTVGSQDNKQLIDILYQLKESTLAFLPYSLQRMRQEEWITQEVVDRLLEKPYTLLEMELLEEAKSGSVVTQYLPPRSGEIMGK